MVTRARRRAFGVGRRIVVKATTRPSRRRHELVGHPDRWETQRRFQFEFLISRGLLPEDRLLDIGCGALRGGIPFIDYLEAGHYTGIEARATVVKEARKELAASGLEHKHPVLVQAEDPADVQIEGPFDYAWAFMALIHMPDDVVDGYLGVVSRALAEDGEFYANVKLGEGPEGSWQGFPVVWRPREFYERLAASHELVVDDIGTLESLGHRVGTVGDASMMLRFTRAPR